MYQDLLEMERRLDWTMMRKKVEVQDALTRNPTVAWLCHYTCLTRLTNLVRQRGRCEYFLATRCLDSYGKLVQMWQRTLRLGKASQRGRLKSRDECSRYARPLWKLLSYTQSVL
jgi:hypothetical protein